MGDYSLVVADGHVDAADCQALGKAINQAGLSLHGNVWVDCERVASISTEALRAVLSLSSTADKTGVALVFYQLSPALKEVMRDSRLDSVLHIVPSIAEAGKMCRKGRGL
ncbi:STAS domain-containing protein [Pontibacter akesuensis]|nr:STAS domain-containing protein [Pontibacter akesuensis]